MVSVVSPQVSTLRPHVACGSLPVAALVFPVAALAYILLPVTVDVLTLAVEDLLRLAVLERLRAARPSSIPLGAELVDSSPTGAGEEKRTTLHLLTRDVPPAAWRALELRYLGALGKPCSVCGTLGAVAGVRCPSCAGHGEVVERYGAHDDDEERVIALPWRAVARSLGMTRTAILDLVDEAKAAVRAARARWVAGALVDEAVVSGRGRTCRPL